jgi:hypothetical protein
VSDHPYQVEFDRFFESLARGEDMPLTGLADAVRTHEVIFAADLSWQQKRPVKLTEIRNADIPVREATARTGMSALRKKRAPKRKEHR